jgi:hypothetical protein
MIALLIAAGGLIVAVIGNAIIDPSPRSQRRQPTNAPGGSSSAAPCLPPF